MPYYSSILGVTLLLVSGIMGAILLLAPGSIRLQRPDCGWVGWAFNIFNLLIFFLLVPVCSLMMTLETPMPWFLCLELSLGSLQILLDVIGVLVFLLGSGLLLWSRLSLRRSFRLGGVKPSSTDYLTMHGPYKIIRHPMYLSAMLVLLGLTLILASAVMLIMLLIMIYLVKRLIPVEELQLDQAYPLAYAEYCRRVPGAMFPAKRHHR
jgi:protein-S-isoprenylcysteine O-methyltransferase Ste14